MKNEVSLTIKPNEKLGERLFKEALAELKQDRIDGTVDNIKKEVEAVETCNHEISLWERLRGKYYARIEALKAGEFTVGYRGVIDFKDKELNNPSR